MPRNAESVCDLAAHCRLHELAKERKAFSTIENHRLLFKRYIEPRWGSRRLGAVRTMEVEEWLHSLPLAPASKAKLKCVMAVLYNHAIRHEWLTFNPISRVRTSQKRDALAEFNIGREQILAKWWEFANIEPAKTAYNTSSQGKALDYLWNALGYSDSDPKKPYGGEADSNPQIYCAAWMRKPGDPDYEDDEALGAEPEVVDPGPPVWSNRFDSWLSQYPSWFFLRDKCQE